MGVCLITGMLIASKGGCLRAPSEWKKEEEKKDGLDVYTHVDINNLQNKIISKTNYHLFCPICDINEPQEIKSKVEAAIEKGPYMINRLESSCNDLIRNRQYIDIFENLEDYMNKIQEYLEHYDENRFYKHKCSKKNKECYMVLYQYSKEEYIKSNNFVLVDNRYEISKWKNDENLKKTLIQERTEANKKYQEEEKIRLFKEKVEEAKREARKEWTEITFQREYDKYLQQIPFIDKEVDSYRSMKSWGDDYVFGSEAELYSFLKYWNAFEYSGGKIKIAEYIAQYAKSNTDRDWFLIKAKPQMSEKEQKEYKIFEKQRIPKM